MKKSIVIFLVLLLAACAEEVMQKPENLIPKEKMVQILHDLAILDAAQSSFRSTLKNNNMETMEFLYKKYGIDSAQFSQSDLYYASIPLEYQNIYEEVERKLDERKKFMEDITKRRNDSIREANQKTKDSVGDKSPKGDRPTPDS